MPKSRETISSMKPQHSTPTCQPCFSWRAPVRNPLLGANAHFLSAWLLLCAHSLALDRDPALRGRWPSFPRGSAWGVAVQNGNAFVAADRAGLVVVDVSDPAKPQRVGGYDTGGRQVAVSGNFAFLASSDANLQVIDLSHPANPQRVGRSDTSGYAQEVAVAGNYDCLIERRWTGSNHVESFVVIDVSNPANPRRVGGNASLYGGEITVANDKVFIASEEQGLVITHLYRPLRFEEVTRQESGALILRLAGPPAVPGRVQRSDDLVGWTDWLPVTFGEDPVEISAPDAASTPLRFYRLTVP